MKTLFVTVLVVAGVAVVASGLGVWYVKCMVRRVRQMF